MTRSTFDLILTNCTVIDGSSPDTQPFRADIGIVADRIAAIGELSQEAADQRYDAGGKVASPGFIDIHTHSDISLGYHPEQLSSISMGVTSQIVGNCGLAMGFAQDSDTFSFEKRWLAPHRGRISWNSYPEYLDQVEAEGSGNNIVPLTGHGTLRKRVMGETDRAPEEAEFVQMESYLQEAMEAGAWGLSSGLEYPPSCHAGEAELARLCRVLKPFGGLYATHLRNEGDTLVESVQEALNVAAAAGVPLQLSHHKAEGSANWGKINTTLDMVDKARAAGLDVQTDQYPYTAFMTSLAIQILPRHALTGSQDQIAERLQNPEYRFALRNEMLAAHPEWDDLSEDSPWLSIQIGTCRHRPETMGKTIAALAIAVGSHPVDYALELLSEPGYTSAVNFAICEPDIATVIRYPWTSIGSDGSGSAPHGTRMKEQIHPRTYGTFPRVLAQYVRERGVLSLPEAIFKMTGLPAARMHLKGRGVLAVGGYADITLFDPDTIEDMATFDSPHRYATGIDAVLVNGGFALKGGSPVGSRNGKLLRRGR